MTGAARGVPSAVRPSRPLPRRRADAPSARSRDRHRRRRRWTPAKLPSICAGCNAGCRRRPNASRRTARTSGSSWTSTRSRRRLSSCSARKTSWMTDAVPDSAPTHQHMHRLMTPRTSRRRPPRLPNTVRKGGINILGGRRSSRAASEGAGVDGPGDGLRRVSQTRARHHDDTPPPRVNPSVPHGRHRTQGRPHPTRFVRVGRGRLPAAAPAPRRASGPAAVPARAAPIPGFMSAKTFVAPAISSRSFRNPTPPAA